ncbi:MAG: hypothetical protein KF688_00575 [Pirellulales bacterium]|nr:hypothetical protein [Pirellulales bacterium]
MRSHIRFLTPPLATWLLLLLVVFGSVEYAGAATAAPKPLSPGWRRTLQRPAAAVVAGPAADAALGPIIADMHAAAEALAALASVPAAERSQQAALVKLDAALAQLERQCQQSMGGTCSKPGSGPPKLKPGGKPGGANPNRSVAATGQGNDVRASLAAAEDLVRDVWGHLPERQRDELLQPLREEFLPEYAAEIEAYFRALAEPDADDQGAL